MGRKKVEQPEEAASQPITVMEKDTSRKCENINSFSFLVDVLTERLVLKQMTGLFIANEAWDLHLRHVQMSLQYMNSSKWQDGTAGPVPD